MPAGYPSGAQRQLVCVGSCCILSSEMYFLWPGFQGEKKKTLGVNPLGWSLRGICLETVKPTALAHPRTLRFTRLKSSTDTYCPKKNMGVSRRKQKCKPKLNNQRYGEGPQWIEQITREKVTEASSLDKTIFPFSLRIVHFRLNNI